MKPFCTSQSMTGLFCDAAFHNDAETGLSPLRTTTQSAANHVFLSLAQNRP